MLDLIKRMSITQLEVAHANKHESDEFIQKIDVLCRGGLSTESYSDNLLVPRYGETSSEFERRKKLFDYANVIGSAINELVSKFSWGTSNLTPVNKSLQEHYRNLEINLQPDIWLPKILRSALKYRSVWAVYEPISIEGEIPNVQRQREAFKNYKPSISLYYPTNVLLEGDGWIKLVNTKEIVTPLGETYESVRVRFIDSENYYSFRYEKKDNKYRLPGQTEWSANKSELFITPEVVPVITGTYPVFKFTLPDEKYVANQVYLQQQSHTRIYNALIDAAASTGQLYKWYTPLKDAGLQSLPKPLENNPRGRDFTPEETLKVGNTSILKAEKLEIAETTGQCLKALREELHDIERNIKAIVMLSGISYNIEAVKQSGVSKAFDNINIEASLREFGMLVCGFYQKIVNYYSLLIGDSDYAIVSGYDSFNLDSLDSCLDVSERIESNPRISEDYKNFYGRKAEKLLSPNGELDSSNSENSVTTL